MISQTETDIPTQALKESRVTGEGPNCTINVSFKQWNFLNKMRAKMIVKNGNRKTTYKEVIAKLIDYYDGEFS